MIRNIRTFDITDKPAIPIRLQRWVCFLTKLMYPQTDGITRQGFDDNDVTNLDISERTYMIAKLTVLLRP